MRGRRGCDNMVFGFTTICAVSVYHHYRCEFEPQSWHGILNRGKDYCLVLNAIVNDISAISWWSALLKEEVGVPGEKHQPAAASH
jgi:hypothetical protein